MTQTTRVTSCTDQTREVSWGGKKNSGIKFVGEVSKHVFPHGHILTKHKPHEMMFAMLLRYLNTFVVANEPVGSTQSARRFTSLSRVSQIYSAFYRVRVFQRVLKVPSKLRCEKGNA